AYNPSCWKQSCPSVQGPPIQSESAMDERKTPDNLPTNARVKLRETKQPGWFPPMLATLTDERFSREGWLFEPKLDGVRCLVFQHGGDVRLFSRNRKPLNETYPEITMVFQRQEMDSFITDGEIVAFKDGVTSFAKL